MTSNLKMIDSSGQQPNSILTPEFLHAIVFQSCITYCVSLNLSPIPQKG